MDVGTTLTWCDKGRVWTCLEKQTGSGATAKRACCSSTLPSTKGAACWRMDRARGTVKVVSQADADAGLGAPPALLQCDRGNRFGVGNATWKTKTATEGALKTDAGRICTAAAITDATAILWATRLRSASVTPRGKLSDAYKSRVKTSWATVPFNVRVADAALDGGALEDVFAGMGYRDAHHRRPLLNVLGWFPGFCGDRAKGDTRPWRAVCRAEMAAAATFALMGEADEAAYRYEIKTYRLYGPAAWW